VGLVPDISTHSAQTSFPPPAMSAPTDVAAPPLSVGEKPIAKPKKQPYPFWLGGNEHALRSPPSLLRT
jgi:hypothetical protein